MEIVIERKNWVESGTFNLPGKAQCIGSYILNAIGFPMKTFKENGKSEELEKAFSELSQKYDLPDDFQFEAMKYNDEKNEQKLIDLFANKNIQLVFID